jgi:hypothetical protein
MKLLICIDDTDDLDSKGTGEIAVEISEVIYNKIPCVISDVTRHQLFIHEDIPYTSHNSSMCFEVVLSDANDYEKVISLSENHLSKASSPLSDPGLCVCKHDEVSHEKLISYGQNAKKVVLTKEVAYKLAKEEGLFLNEYGGTGDGVIGALAGIGLRLSGSDGRFKGKHKINPDTYLSNDLLELLSIDEVMDFETGKVLCDLPISLEGKVKSVYLNHKRVLPVYKKENIYHNCIKEQLRRY